MKKHIFSFSLYKEGLRQTQTIGFLTLILLALATIIPIIGTSFSRGSESPEINALYAYVPESISVSYPQDATLFVLCICVVAPLMTLYLFRFLNKRNSSDFYHALPYVRTTLYVSYAAAAITWTLAALATCLFSSALTYLVLFGSSEAFSLTICWWQLFLLLFTAAATCLLVIAACLIAVGLTGTTFSNVVVTGLILFLPRFLLWLIQYLVYTDLPLVVGDHLCFPFGRYNLVFSLVYSFIDGSYQSIFLDVTNGIYTLCLACVYFCIGAWIFSRRHSETAEKSASSPRMQTVYRLCIGFTISIVPTLCLTRSLLNRETLDGYSLFVYFVLYLIAVLAYLVYELVTTRKPKNMLRSVPSLLILLVLNLATAGIAVGIHSAVLSQTPTAEEIESVQFDFSSGDNAFGYMVSKVELKEETIRTFVANRLNKEVQSIRKGTEDYGYIPFSVRIRLKSGRTLYRNILIDKDSDLNFLNAWTVDSAAYKQACAALPEAEKCTIEGSSLSKEQARSVYASLREEITEYDAEKWYSVADPIGNFRYGESWTTEEYETEYDVEYALGYLHVTYREGSETLYMSLPIRLEYPKTAALYMQYCNESRAAEIINASFEKDVPFHLYFFSHNGDVNIPVFPDDPAQKAIAEEFVSWMRENAAKAPDLSSSFDLLEIQYNCDGVYLESDFRVFVFPENGSYPAWYVKLRQLKQENAG